LVSPYGPSKSDRHRGQKFSAPGEHRADYLRKQGLPDIARAWQNDRVEDGGLGGAMHVGRSELLAGCTVTWSDDRIILTGDVDELNADAVAERLRAGIANASTISTLDLTGVTFFSAAGVRLLSKVGAVARAADAIVHVTCSPVAWRIAILCGATDFPGLVLDRVSHRDPDAASGRGAAR
jgi:anti-anti-sigma regulatory factor